ncbi:alcohol dehydrogenase-like regulatory protein ErcA [Desulfonatronum sp. SC1]|uniref:alcohol dehydrogenase-like regulatory protein ErcA n=1 Tax=Desulfonatronum sp. SC1 TaxID=2109626 RepID=UPI000D30EF82|nr:alcohol dehydrogenase-like regulatory protein ErcA [Desulfonatronum sp. SC1]PTN38632.1 alcohol dehydrogenase [Desulfonatronum sp. SC1]
MSQASMENLRKFVAPEFVFGVGARRLAGQFARNFSVRRVLVVVDEVVRGLPWTTDVLTSLDQASLEYRIFSDLSPNPRADEVMRGARYYLREDCQAIVALGGGSVLDCAKGIGIVCVNNRPILDFEGVDNVPVPGPPLVCIPTTAGSSADVSQFAIITDLARKVKIAIISKAMVPDIALIDPETTTSMSPHLTACTGYDALTHAVEAFASNASSPITDLHALEAVRLIAKHLPQAVEAPQDMEARSKMMLASLYAGLAFSNASLGATHAMAHSLGGLLDLPHGECNAILLSRIVNYNYEAAPERYLNVAEALGLDCRDLGLDEGRRILVDGLVALRKRIGLLRDLGDLGVSPDDIVALSRQAVRDPCMVTNPIHPCLEDIERLYARNHE